jgi:hypothetical protein
MTLAEARKNGIPGLGVKGCKHCAEAGCPVDMNGRHFKPHCPHFCAACTAPSDEAIFAAVWAERERLKERAEAIQEAVNKTAGVLIHANRNLSASVDLALEILHDYAPAPVDPTSSEELNGRICS